mmetsp:Transcript_46660/g.122545  ORF Transcript_46660/g.122545 Transcript_46660/m.122545 type:complete len:318 (-) Transcript_46660:515-1468(-)
MPHASHARAARSVGRRSTPQPTVAHTQASSLPPYSIDCIFAWPPQTRSCAAPSLAHDTSTALSPPPPLPFFLFGFFFFSVETASSSTSVGSSTEYSELASGGGPAVIRAVLSEGSSSAVNLYCATNSSFFSYSTGYSMKRSCLTHSVTPSRHSRSSPARSVKGIVGKRWLTSEKNFLEAFILREYLTSTLRLKTVVRSSNCLGLPSPVLITTSMAKTSFFASFASGTCCSGVCLLMIVLLASITCRFIWCDSTPSTGLHLYDSATVAIAFVISLFEAPSLSIRCATSPAVHAAMITSALRPSALSEPTSTVCATTAT